jgi:hypothetical protein
VSNAKNPCPQRFSVARLGILQGFFFGQRLILFVRENYYNCASSGNSAQFSFSSAHTKN